jgi:hypothetical protein
LQQNLLTVTRARDEKRRQVAEAQRAEAAAQAAREEAVRAAQAAKEEAEAAAKKAAEEAEAQRQAQEAKSKADADAASKAAADSKAAAAAAAAAASAAAAAPAAVAAPSALSGGGAPSQAAQEMSARMQVLQSCRAAAAPFVSNPACKAQRLQLTRHINLAVSQISGTVSQVRSKAGALLKLLAATQASAEQYSFCLELIASKIVGQGYAKVRLMQDAAFPFAMVAVHVAIGQSGAGHNQCQGDAAGMEGGL